MQALASRPSDLRGDATSCHAAGGPVRDNEQVLSSALRRSTCGRRVCVGRLLFPDGSGQTRVRGASSPDETACSRHVLRPLRGDDRARDPCRGCLGQGLVRPRRADGRGRGADRGAGRPRGARGSGLRRPACLRREIRSTRRPAGARCAP